MVPGSGCVQVDSANPQRLRCNRPSLGFVTFVGGGLRDRFFVLDGSGDCQCSGGGGNDELHGADGADLIDGGTGADVITGSHGDDVLRGGDGSDTITGGLGNDKEFGGVGDDVFPMGGVPDGADDLNGEGGTDEVDYGSRRAAVSVTNDGNADDGAPAGAGMLFGERDLVRVDIEVLRGGGGNDFISSGIAGNTVLFGGPGDDTVRGDSGNDVLNGDAGVDALNGRFGNDTINARDAIDDQVNERIVCSGGTDRLDADVRDDDTRPLPLPSDCETIDQGMVGEHPNVLIRSVRRGRGERLKILLRCPRKTRKGCNGQLSAGRLSGTGARAKLRYGEAVRYKVKRGKSRVVITRVRGRKSVRRGAKIGVRSVERGRLGPRTTFKLLKVRR
jgi:Ca2+-binding RTX toxin-like protein